MIRTHRNRMTVCLLLGGCAVMPRGAPISVPRSPDGNSPSVQQLSCHAAPDRDLHSRVRRPEIHPNAPLEAPDCNIERALIAGDRAACSSGGESLGRGVQIVYTRQKLTTGELACP